MIVCLDSGNTRIKWGVHDGTGWLAQGAVLHADVWQLSQLAEQWPYPERVVLANVAGEDAGQRIRQQLVPWQKVLCEVKSTPRCCGVTNLYNIPERLGVDRWCALIGAWAMFRKACVVVMAGTATTIDTLDAQGNFLGGDILPGVGMMQGALARGTAALPFAEGRYVSYPRGTDDAIVSGVLEAQAGAVERVYARLRDPEGLCVLSGGYSEGIIGCLVVKARLAQNLPLEGLARIAREMS